MNSVIANLSKAVDTLLSEIVAANTAIFKQANDERIEMNALLARMTATCETIQGMGELYHEVAEEFDTLSENCAEMAGKITVAIDDPAEYCPTMSYESLRGFCDDCGAEIGYGDDCAEDDDGVGLVCANCVHIEEVPVLAESVN